MDQQLTDIDQKLNDITKILLREREQTTLNKLHKEVKYGFLMVSLAVIGTVLLVAFNKISCDGAAVFLAAISTIFTTGSFYFVILITFKQNENKNG